MFHTDCQTVGWWVMDVKRSWFLIQWISKYEQLCWKMSGYKGTETEGRKASQRAAAPICRTWHHPEGDTDVTVDQLHKDTSLSSTLIITLDCSVKIKVILRHKGSTSAKTGRSMLSRVSVPGSCWRNWNWGWEQCHRLSPRASTTNPWPSSQKPRHQRAQLTSMSPQSCRRPTVAVVCDMWGGNE